MKKRTKAPKQAVEIYQCPNKEWRWRVIGNYRILAISSESYKRKAGALRGLKRATWILWRG